MKITNLRNVINYFRQLTKRIEVQTLFILSWQYYKGINVNFIGVESTFSEIIVTCKDHKFHYENCTLLIRVEIIRVLIELHNCYYSDDRGWSLDGYHAHAHTHSLNKIQIKLILFSLILFLRNEEKIYRCYSNVNSR